MKNSTLIIAVLCIGTLAGHAFIYQQNHIETLRQNLSLTEKACSIETDQVRELMFVIQRLNTEKESIATQSYVSGVVSAFDNKEHVEKIWHDGYDRGSEVQMLVHKTQDEIAIDKIKTELNLKSPLEDLEK